jgi:CRP-like cAMP-binding protein
MSLGAGTVCSASVTATGPTELAELPRRDFIELVSAHPAVWEGLRSESQRRELATANILAGDTSVV